MGAKDLLMLENLVAQAATQISPVSVPESTPSPAEITQRYLVQQLTHTSNGFNLSSQTVSKGLKYLQEHMITPTNQSPGQLPHLVVAPTNHIVGLFITLSHQPITEYNLLLLIDYDNELHLRK